MACDSVADVCVKNQLRSVPTMAVSLQPKKEGEFDRLLLLVLGWFLVVENFLTHFLNHLALHHELS